MLPQTIVYLVIAGLIIIEVIIVALKISEEYKKYIWILPTVICTLLIINYLSLHGEEQMVGIFYFPVIFLCILFTLVYYLKVLFIFLKPFSFKEKIIIWSIILAVFISITLTLVYVVKKNTREYTYNEHNHPELLSKSLSSYYIPVIKIEQNIDREVKFDSLNIFLPYDIHSKNIIKKKRFMLIENSKNINIPEKETVEEKNLCVVVFDKDVRSDELPVIKDKNLNGFLKGSINLRGFYPKYSERVEAFNKLATYSKDDNLDKIEMDSSEIAFRIELERMYDFLEDLNFKRIVFKNSAIKGIIYEGVYMNSIYSFAEIYLNDEVKYGFVVKDNLINRRSIDYILASIEKQYSK